MVRRILFLCTKFYYYFGIVISLLLILVAVAGTFAQLNEGQSEETLSAAFINAFSSSFSIFVWALVFNQLSFLLSKAQVFSLQKVYRYLLTIFIFNSINLLSRFFYRMPEVRWTEVQPPEGIEPWYIQIYLWYQFIFKILKVSGDFFLPFPFGISALFLALLLKTLSTEKNFKPFKDDL